MAQRTQVWCWAAATEMVRGYLGYPVEQCEVVSAWTAFNCCPPLAQQCFVAAPSIEYVDAAIDVGPVETQLYYYPLNFDAVRYEIDLGHPIVIGYSGSFSGHVVVLFGYDDSGNVYIHDPNAGTFVVPYGTANLYAGSAVWSHSIVVSSF
jgi:hypothetical protein